MVNAFTLNCVGDRGNHKQNYIKIPCINKVMEFIYLHSILKDNLVISSIPNYLKNSETPIICYK